MPTEATLGALLATRTTLGRVRYVNIGQSASREIWLSPHILHRTQVEPLGSGLGSVSPAEMARETPALRAAAARGALTIDLELVPLAHVADAWQAAPHGKRIVITPRP